MLTLFEITTLEMFLEVQARLQDITGVDSGPKLRASDNNTWFMVFFILAGTFFLMVNP